MSVQSIESSQAAFAFWETIERRIRMSAALMKADTLDALASTLRPEDLFDAAYAGWAEFIEGRRHAERLDVLTESERGEQATVFLRLMPYLSHREIIAAARATWGEVEFVETGRERGAVSWMPSDGSVILTIPKGTHAVVMVITEDGSKGNTTTDRVFAKHDEIAGQTRGAAA